MKTFKEFLQEQAEPLRQEAAAKRARVDAWIKSVERLFAQMMEWLKDADPQNLLTLDQRPMEWDETWNWIPHHRFPTLTIRLGGRSVSVTPLIGDVLGPGIRKVRDKELRGRVDLTNGPITFMLYCYVEPSGEENWIVLDDRTFETRPFSREAFEAALVSLLG